MTRAEALAAIPAGDPWRLAGPRHAKLRAQIMGAIIGRKASQAESGVTAIRAELCRQYQIEGGTLGARAHRLAAAILENQAQPRHASE